jgi:hypothetical protein
MRDHLNVGRRTFLRSAAVGAAGVLGTSAVDDAIAESLQESASQQKSAQSDQERREEVEIFCRSMYDAKDGIDAPKFASHFADPHIYQDATGGGHCGALATPQALQERYANGVFKRVGVPGKLCKFVHASGDMRYGAIAEVVNLPGSFYAAGLDLMGVLELKDGRVCRNTDYWDTRQLTQAIISEGATALHPNGMPRQRPSCMPNKLPADTPHASKEMLEFARDFNEALAAGRADRVLKFFTEDALFIHPVLHSGAPHYGMFNRGIQIRGKDAIGRLMKAVLPLLPDGASPTVMNVVGGPTGGGYEWKAGGIYARQGLTREGIRGATALDLFGARILRMSVKFDAMQMTQDQRDAIDARLGRG